MSAGTRYFGVGTPKRDLQETEYPHSRKRPQTAMNLLQTSSTASAVLARELSCEHDSKLCEGWD